MGSPDAAVGSQGGRADEGRPHWKGLFGSVIFVGGFRPDYRPWLPWPAAFDDLGFPVQTDGASTVVDGLYFVGVPFMRTRKSPLLLGVAARLTPAAYSNGLALALPQVVMARPEGFGPALATYTILIEGRDEWLAATARHLA